MLKESTSKGLIIYKDAPAYQNFLNTTPMIDGTMHNEQKGFVGKLFRRQRRSWNEKTHGAPTLHESVLTRTRNNVNTDAPKYSPWIFDFKERNIES
jgi:hypothetical protein